MPEGVMTRSSRLRDRQRRDSAPVTGFTANKTSGTSPLAVGFTDSSTNTPTNWDWYWYANETKSSDAQNPVATLTTGVYNVRLYTSNSAGGDWENKTAFHHGNTRAVVPVTGFRGKHDLRYIPAGGRVYRFQHQHSTNWDW